MKITLDQFSKKEDTLLLMSNIKICLVSRFIALDAHCDSCKCLEEKFECDDVDGLFTQADRSNTLYYRIN